jgi:CheY-like chemotaxis protein
MNASTQGILLVEDDPNDVFFMKRAMTKAGLNHPVHVAENGRDAIEYLSGDGPYADRASHPIPHCIFLDLKMPFVNGFEFLEWLRAQPALSHLGVIVLTSSPEESDRQRARELGAKGYIIKPPTPEIITNALKAIPECAPAATPANPA